MDFAVSSPSDLARDRDARLGPAHMHAKRENMQQHYTMEIASKVAENPSTDRHQAFEACRHNKARRTGTAAHGAAAVVTVKLDSRPSRSWAHRPRVNGLRSTI